ncbi:hypothetical protein BU16DRAFT_537071 [Lophium mytilinum]|uniref:Uncharacterized protein n=1 Tax=Lophium mytilinum TaxID=390894 RepID=A0A6A6QY52_9PEZI|nr:hypothetical protein BU16DRAFT_537071 [Lophium mytilinum]
MSSHNSLKSNPVSPSSPQPIGLGIVCVEFEDYIPRANMLPGEEFAFLKRQHEQAQQACIDESLREKHGRLSEEADQEHRLIVNQVKMRSMNVPSATDPRWLDPEFDPDELPEYASERFPNYLPPGRQERYNQRAWEDNMEFDRVRYQDDMTETSFATWRTHGKVDEVLATRLAYLARYGQRLESRDPTFMALIDPPGKQEAKSEIQDEAQQEAKTEKPLVELNTPSSSHSVHKRGKLLKFRPEGKKPPASPLSTDSSLNSLYQQPVSAFSDDTIVSPFSPLSQIARGIKKTLSDFGSDAGSRKSE